MSERWPYGTILRYATSEVRAMVVAEAEGATIMTLLRHDPVQQPGFELEMFQRPTWYWAWDFGERKWWKPVDADT